MASLGGTVSFVVVDPKKWLQSVLFSCFRGGVHNLSGKKILLSFIVVRVLT